VIFLDAKGVRTVERSDKLRQTVGGRRIRDAGETLRRSGHLALVEARNHHRAAAIRANRNREEPLELQRTEPREICDRLVARREIRVEPGLRHSRAQPLEPQFDRRVRAITSCN